MWYHRYMMNTTGTNIAPMERQVKIRVSEATHSELTRFAAKSGHTVAGITRFWINERIAAEQAEEAAQAAEQGKAA